MRVLVQEGEPFFRQRNSQIARDLIMMLSGRRVMLGFSVVGVQCAVSEALCCEVSAELKVLILLPILEIPSADSGWCHSGWCLGRLLRRFNAARLEEGPCLYQGRMFLFFSEFL